MLSYVILFKNDAIICHSFQKCFLLSNQSCCAALCGVVMYNYIKVKDVRASSQLPVESIPDRIAKVSIIGNPSYCHTRDLLFPV